MRTALAEEGPVTTNQPTAASSAFSPSSDLRITDTRKWLFLENLDARIRPILELMNFTLGQERTVSRPTEGRCGSATFAQRETFTVPCLTRPHRLIVTWVWWITLPVGQYGR